MKKNFALLAFFVIMKSFVYAQTEKFQALYLYNFCKYFQWPNDQRNGNFIFGIMGRDEKITSHLKTFVTNKKIGVQPTQVTEFYSYEALEKCQILFVPARYTKYIPQMLATCIKNKTLIVSEDEKGIKLGAAVNFLLIDNKLRFELSKSNTTKFGIDIASSIDNLCYKIY